MNVVYDALKRAKLAEENRRDQPENLDDLFAGYDDTGSLPFNKINCKAIAQEDAQKNTSNQVVANVMKAG